MILFMEHDIEKARNLKLILATFEHLSGLKINFHKSELFCFGEAQDEASLYADLFGCEQGQFSKELCHRENNIGLICIF
jgi:hypothetical protein